MPVAGDPSATNAGPSDAKANAQNVLTFSMADGRAVFDPHRVRLTSAAAATGAAQTTQTVALGAFDLQVANGAGLASELWVSTDTDPANPVRNAGRYQVVCQDGVRLAKVIAAGADDQDRVLEDQSLIWADGPLAANLALAIDDAIDTSAAQSTSAVARSVDLSLKRDGGAPAPAPAPAPASGPAPAQVGGSSVRVLVLDPAPMSVSSVTTQLSLVARAGQRRRRHLVVVRPALAPDGERVDAGGARPAGARVGRGVGASPRARRRLRLLARRQPAGQLSRRAVGARVRSLLGPAAALNVQTEPRARNAAAAWDLRRLLGDPTAEQPGTTLQSILRLEALYGLEAHDTPTPRLRIAELAAWRGEPRDIPVGLQGDAQGDIAPRAKAWTAARDAFLRRLAILDVRVDGDDAAPTTIEDVNFRLRPTGHYPNPTTSDIKPPSGWPGWDANGVAGGALAGFEDAGLILSLLNNAENGAGTLEGLKLSALGAWTHPRAGFNQGLTQISARVEMGRTQEARFERFGRISISRNRAKHVIVYQRTFLPSRQFVGDQDAHLGRPIVRKVEEYIEIIEPQRTLASEGGDPAKTLAYLGTNFRTVRIPVHGSWRFALGTADAPMNPPPADDPGASIGYAIPLWREGADPAVYPYPNAEGMLASAAAYGTAGVCAARITNLQLLHFYTLFDEGPDVDKWPSVSGLDMGDAATDSPVAYGRSPAQKDFQGPGGPAEKLAPAALAPDALAPFTLLLEPGPLVNLANARASKPVMAQLESVTLMRADPVAAASDKTRALSATSTLDTVRDKARCALAALAVDAANAAATPSALQALKDRARELVNNGALKDVKTGIGQLRALRSAKGAPVLSGPVTLACGWVDDQRRKIDGTLADAKHQVDSWFDQATEALQSGWSQGPATLMGDLQALEDQLAGLEPPSAMANRAFGGALQQLTDDLEQQLTLIEASIDGGVNELGALFDAAAADLSARCAASVQAAKTALTNLTASPLNLSSCRAAAAVVRSLVRAMQNREDSIQSGASQIERTLIAASQLIGARAPSVASALQDGVRQIDGFASGIATGVGVADDAAIAAAQMLEGAIATVEAGGDAALTALGSALNGVASQLDQEQAAALKAVQDTLSKAKAALAGEIAEFKNTLQQSASDLQTLAKKFPIPGVVDDTFAGAVQDMRGALDTFRKVVARGQPTSADLATLKQAFKPVTDLLDDAAGAVDTAHDTVCSFITSATAELQQWLGDASTQIDTFINSIVRANSAADIASAINQAIVPFDQAVARYAGAVRDALPDIAGAAGAYTGEQRAQAAAQRGAAAGAGGAGVQP